MNQIVDLINVEYTTSASGIQTANITSRKTVFCDFQSVGMRETYKALAINRNPEVVARLSDYYDYSGEQFAAIDGQVYRVLRTYRDGLSIDLTLERTRDLDGVI